MLFWCWWGKAARSTRGLGSLCFLDAPITGSVQSMHDSSPFSMGARCAWFFPFQYRCKVRMILPLLVQVQGMHDSSAFSTGARCAWFFCFQYRCKVCMILPLSVRVLYNTSVLCTEFSNNSLYGTVHSQSGQQLPFSHPASLSSHGRK